MRAAGYGLTGAISPCYLTSGKVGIFACSADSDGYINRVAQTIPGAKAFPDGLSVGGSAVITYIDNDAELSTDSDDRVPTQSAVKAYVDTTFSSGVVSYSPPIYLVGSTIYLKTAGGVTVDDIHTDDTMAEATSHTLCTDGAVVGYVAEAMKLVTSGVRLAADGTDVRIFGSTTRLIISDELTTLPSPLRIGYGTDAGVGVTVDVDLKLVVDSEVSVPKLTSSGSVEALALVVVGSSNWALQAVGSTLIIANAGNAILSLTSTSMVFTTPTTTLESLTTSLKTISVPTTVVGVLTASTPSGGTGAEIRLSDSSATWALSTTASTTTLTLKRGATVLETYGQVSTVSAQRRVFSDSTNASIDGIASVVMYGGQYITQDLIVAGNVHSAGGVKITSNGGSNSLYTDSSSNVLLDVPRWKSHSIFALLRGSGAGLATWNQIGTLNFYGWDYTSVTTNTLYGCGTVPNDIVPTNAGFTFYINWLCATVATGNAHFQIALSYANPEGVFSAEVILELLAPSNGVAYSNHHHIFPTQTLAAPQAGSQVLFRLIRNRDASDTLNVETWVVGFGILYQASKLLGGSEAT